MKSENKDIEKVLLEIDGDNPHHTLCMLHLY
jgi:hypothetical protein